MSNVLEPYMNSLIYQKLDSRCAKYGTAFCTLVVYFFFFFLFFVLFVLFNLFCTRNMKVGITFFVLEL